VVYSALIFVHYIKVLSKKLNQQLPKKKLKKWTKTVNLGWIFLFTIKNLIFDLGCPKIFIDAFFLVHPVYFIHQQILRKN